MNAQYTEATPPHVFAKVRAHAAAIEEHVGSDESVGPRSRVGGVGLRRRRARRSGALRIRSVEACSAAGWTVSA